MRTNQTILSKLQAEITQLQSNQIEIGSKQLSKLSTAKLLAYLKKTAETSGKIQALNFTIQLITKNEKTEGGLQ